MTFIKNKHITKGIFILVFYHLQKLYKPVKPHSDTVTSSRFYPVFDIDIVFTTLFSKIEIVNVSKKKKKKKTGSSITCQRQQHRSTQKRAKHLTETLFEL